MKPIRETDLPGIGRKFLIETQSHDRLTVVVHDDGKRELYHHYYDDPDETISMITLNDNEARSVAGILGGMVYRPKALENMEIALNDMVIEWCKVEPHYKAVDKTIGQLEVRKKTGVSVIAIIEKDNTKIINPGPDNVIHEGATIVLVGERNQIKSGKSLISTGAIC